MNSVNLAHYDCHKTSDYIHEARRFCESQKDCANCMFYLTNDRQCPYAQLVNAKFDIEKHIELLQFWSDMHPQILDEKENR
jgi:hypothetical protein